MRITSIGQPSASDDLKEFTFIDNFLFYSSSILGLFVAFLLFCMRIRETFIKLEINGKLQVLNLVSNGPQNYLFWMLFFSPPEAATLKVG